METGSTLIVNSEPLNQLLEEIKLEPCSDIFLLPVDWRALGLETYPTIVKNPMDLSTLQVSIAQPSYIINRKICSKTKSRQSNNLCLNSI